MHVHYTYLLCMQNSKEEGHVAATEISGCTAVRVTGTSGYLLPCAFQHLVLA